MYELVGPTTLLQIIAQAGGLTALTMKDIYIYRKGRDGEQTRIVVNIEDLMINGKPGLNIELQPKDVVTVPLDQTLNVFVYGEVRTPGVVPFLGSKRITLLQAVAQAGGTTEWARKTKGIIPWRQNSVQNCSADSCPNSSIIGISSLNGNGFPYFFVWRSSSPYYLLAY